MVYSKVLQLKTKGPYDLVDLTEQVQAAIEESGAKQGVLFLNCLHTTAALLVQEADPSIHEDLKDMLDELVPMDRPWRHSYEGNRNATAHLKQNLLHSCLTLPFLKQKLVLGTWQRIFLIELFEARQRKVLVTIASL